MTKGGLVDELARGGLTKEASEDAVSSVFESITGALVKGERGSCGASAPLRFAVDVPARAGTRGPAPA